MLEYQWQDKMLDKLFDAEIDGFLNKRDVEHADIYEDGIPPVTIKEFVQSPDYLGLGDKIYPKVISILTQIMDPKIREAYTLLGKGSGKCFDENEYVLTPEGYFKGLHIKPNVETKEKEYSVYMIPLVNKDKETEITSYFYNNGLDTVYQVSTREGYSTRITAEHKLYVFDGVNFVWKKPGELTGSDYITLPRVTGRFSTNYNIRFLKNRPCTERKLYRALGIIYTNWWTEDFARVLAVMSAGDMTSAVYKEKVNISPTRPPLDAGAVQIEGEDWAEEVHDIYALFRRVLGAGFNEKIYSGDSQCDIEIYHPYLKTYFGNMGMLDYKDPDLFPEETEYKEREVPEVIMCAPKEIQVAYLRQLYNLYGYVINANNISYTVGLSNLSKKFLQQIQLMLLNMGIDSTIYDGQTFKIPVEDRKATEFLATTQTGVDKDNFHYALMRCYQLEIGDQASLLIFRDSIDFKEESEPYELLHKWVPVGNYSRLVLKYNIPLYKALISESKLSSTDKVDLYGTDSIAETAKFIPLTEIQLVKIITADPTLSKDTLAKLKEMKEYSYAQFISSTADKEKCQTIDFTLQGTHSFILSGMSSHNTTSLQTFLAYNMYKLLCLKDPQKFYKLLPGDSIVGLLVSVSENQAREVGFKGVYNMISRSKWFKGKYTAFSKEIKFDKNITLYSGHSGSNAFLGFNTLVAAMDETEWMVDSQNRSVAKELYRALKGSLMSRFPQHYKLLCISSVKNEFSFLNTRFNKIKQEGEPVAI